MAKALLFINQNKENAETHANEIRAGLESRNFDHETLSFNGAFVFDKKDSFGIALSLGGDGTVLHAVRSMAPLGVPVFPVNLGSLGFIAGIYPDNWLNVFDDWLAGMAKLSKRLLLEIKIEKHNGDFLESICLNEMVISSPGIVRLISLNVSLGENLRIIKTNNLRHEKNALEEDKTPAERNDSDSSFRLINFLHLGQYRCDGLIAATPTGSTAHSAAAGGPILDPEIRAFIVNPICPFTLSNRPLVLPSDQTVLIETGGEEKKELLLTIDGQITHTLQKGDRIFITGSPYTGTLIASGRDAFYDALKHKFFWMNAPAKLHQRGNHA